MVGLDASSQRVATRPLAPGLNEPAPQTDVALAMPVRIATVAMAGREDLTVTLTVVDETDPLLAFGEDGVRLPAGLPLPGRPTWLLFPGDPAKLEAEGAAVLSESPLPPGWSGWCLLLVDLEKCESVRVLPTTAPTARTGSANTPRRGSSRTTRCVGSGPPPVSR